ncbi:MAG: VTT domain-containing protein [Candidatus Gracilibacteria bacterium]|nr:VTT domain-containing protein [Candidatus Gracilibacteria bacterium]MDD4530050.1 VTT domain-containing protein [Candidatus Gracilibacteria bacterium]
MDYLLQQAHLLGYYAYLIVFLALFIEGDIALIFIGYLCSRGGLDLFPAFLACFLGTVVGDLFWFCMGKKFMHLDFWIFKKFKDITGSFESHIIKHPIKILCTTKFIYGFHKATCFRFGGVKKLKIIDYLCANIIASAIWIIIILGVGYFSGISIILLKKYVKGFELFFLFIVVAIFLLVRYFGDKLKDEL